MQKWDQSNANEKVLLSQEMTKLRETLVEREKRLNHEIQTLRKEKDDMFVKITSYDLESDKDVAQLFIMINELKRNEEERNKSLLNENTHLVDTTKHLSNKLVQETSKGKVKLHKKPVDKMPVKKAAYLVPSRLSKAH